MKLDENKDVDPIVYCVKQSVSTESMRGSSPLRKLCIASNKPFNPTFKFVVDAPMASNSHLKKALKLSIMPYLEFLKEKVDSIVTNKDLSDKLALLDIGSKTEDPLLKLNDFDKFLSKKRPGVNPGFAKILNENKVWKVTVNIKDQIINLWGELPKDEFKSKGVIPDEFKAIFLSGNLEMMAPIWGVPY